MTDQTIPADKVREIIHANTFRRVVLPHCRASIIDQLEALLPAPPFPTLANMTPKERVACRWMQCDVEGEDARVVIFNPHWEDGSARVLWPGGIIEQIGWERVTPRPDLPRMAWPGDKKPDPAPAPALPDGWRLADHQKHGRGIVTNPVANQMGNVCFVGPTDDSRGHDWLFCSADELTYLDQGADQ